MRRWSIENSVWSDQRFWDLASQFKAARLASRWESAWKSSNKDDATANKLFVQISDRDLAFCFESSYIRVLDEKNVSSIIQFDQSIRSVNSVNQFDQSIQSINSVSCSADEIIIQIHRCTINLRKCVERK